MESLLSPPILFFALGVAATIISSDLEIPQPIPKLFSLYLLFAIGFHGGVELSHSSFSEAWIIIAISISAAFIVPIYSFFVWRLRLDVNNAAALSASYGSVSAVTFITAIAYLNDSMILFSGVMVAALALMESPAIVVGVSLNSLFGLKRTAGISVGHLLREAFFNGSVVLLVGSLLIGYITGDKGFETLKPFTKDIFQGMLCLFLLDMGLIAAKRFSDLKRSGIMLIVITLCLTVMNAGIGMAIAYLVELSVGDALLFTILCASASYIAVPAAIRMSIPEANPGLYISLPLAVTFPFNIAVGLPLYHFIILKLWG